MNTETNYVKGIQARTKFRFLKGLYPRYKNYLKNNYITWLARKNGATIGNCVTMPYKLAKKANSNLVIGNHTSIHTDLIAVRRKIIIGNNVIIGDRVEILTGSHNIDSVDWENKGSELVIEDYTWLATKSFILPSCRKIGRGAVCAAGSVVIKDVDAMSVVVGNPATHLRYRKKVDSDLCVESMLGNDLVAYINAYKNRKSNN